MPTRVALLKDVLSHLPHRWYILDAIMPSKLLFIFCSLVQWHGLRKLPHLVKKFGECWLRKKTAFYMSSFLK